MENYVFEVITSSAFALGFAYVRRIENKIDTMDNRIYKMTEQISKLIGKTSDSSQP